MKGCGRTLERSVFFSNYEFHCLEHLELHGNTFCVLQLDKAVVDQLDLSKNARVLYPVDDE